MGHVALSKSSGCPTESALPALPSWAGRLQGGADCRVGLADCSTDRWLLKQQFRDLNLGFPSPTLMFHPLLPPHAVRGGTLASSLGTLFTGGPGAKGQQGPLCAPGNLLLHLKHSFICSPVSLPGIGTVNHSVLSRNTK